MNRFVIGILVFLAAVILFYYWKNPLGAKVKINDKIFLVDLAITAKKRERGLSGRKYLPQNHGMLFLFDSPGVYHFWMKGMKFPLDFVWIADSTIVDIDEDIQPPKGNERPIEIFADTPVDKVLELNAGVVNQYKISVGDRVEFVK